MNISILGIDRFKRKVLPNLDKFSNTFIISIREPGESRLSEDTDKFKTYFFDDLDQDVEGHFAFTFDQAKDMIEFMKQNFDKHLIVHCHAGIARSSAVAEFFFELHGGSYRDMIEKYPHICPNPRVLQYLRMAIKDFSSLQINFT